MNHTAPPLAPFLLYPNAPTMKQTLFLVHFLAGKFGRAVSPKIYEH